MRRWFNNFVERHEVPWELTMGTLALVFVGIGFATDNPNAAPWLGPAEIVLSVIFVSEFTLRFAAAYNHIGYLKAHWIDLLALVPSVRGLRMLRLLRLLRLVRAFASFHRALSHVEFLLGNWRVATIAVIWFAILIISSFGLYVAEHGLNDAVETPLDALWWGIVTMTTVGYGDVYPVTPEGRLAAVMLMILGIAFFSIITATITGLIMRGEVDVLEEEATQSSRPTKLIGELHSLLLAGAVTSGEFETKKAELLARI